MNGKWVGASDSCSDPKNLFESIIFKPEDVIKYVSFYDFNSNVAYYDNINDYDNWFHFDTKFYGRCFTVLAPSDTKNGNWISAIELILLVDSTIIIHTPGMFVSANEGGQKKQEKSIELGNWYEFSLDFEYHQMLDVDYGGIPCIDDNEYQKDLCFEKTIEKELVDKVGCTTPFGPNKSQICKQEDEISKASEMYGSLYYKSDFIDGCSKPCSIFSFTTTKSEEHEQNSTEEVGVTISFPKNVKVYERTYDYSQLSFIAEVGGYVGLFLGISINQVINLVDYLVSKLEWIYQYFSINQAINLWDYLIAILKRIYQRLRL